MKIAKVYKVVVQLNHWGDCEEKVFFNYKDAQEYFTNVSYYGTKQILPDRILVEE